MNQALGVVIMQMHDASLNIVYPERMNTHDLQPDLIDRIYECSFVPELWPGVLDTLAHLVDARGGHPHQHLRAGRRI